MKVTALLTGRGNNTLPDKNVIDILGKPVLYYSARAARNSKLISEWYCSSDDEKILNAAEKEGYKRIVRPAELSLPTSLHIDCIIHSLEELRKNGNLPDILVVLLANNITIKSSWITDCISAMLQNNNLTAVVPVYEDNDHHPLRAKMLNPDGTLSMYDKNTTTEISTNRQDLQPCYFLAHNFWVLKVNNLLSENKGQPPWSFMGDVIQPYIIDESIDIHREQDLRIAKAWIQSNYND